MISERERPAAKGNSQYAKTVTLKVPFRLVTRGGRKEMQLPEGAVQSRRTDKKLVKALARPFRCKRMLESGELTTIAGLAEQEGIVPSQMTHFLRLTLLTPFIVEAILAGKQVQGMTLTRMQEPFPTEWSDQTRKIIFGHNVSLAWTGPFLNPRRLSGERS